MPLIRSITPARSLLALASGDSDLPPQHLVYLGGPVTGPGYQFHEFAGRAGISQRLEFRTPIPFPAIPLGRYGRTPAQITLAPYAHFLRSQGPETRRFKPVDHEFGYSVTGWYPSVGIGALSVFDLLRIDVARGLRDGRWMFSMDVGRDFWQIL